MLVELSKDEIKYLMFCMYICDIQLCDIDHHLYARLDEFLRNMKNENKQT